MQSKNSDIGTGIGGCIMVILEMAFLVACLVFVF